MYSFIYETTKLLRLVWKTGGDVGEILTFGFS